MAALSTCPIFLNLYILCYSDVPNLHRSSNKGISLIWKNMGKATKHKEHKYLWYGNKLESSKHTWRRAELAFCCWFFPDHWTASIITSHKIRTTSMSGNLASLTRCFTFSMTSDISVSSCIWVVNADFISFSFTSNIFFSLYSTKATRPSLLPGLHYLVLYCLLCFWDII